MDTLYISIYVTISRPPTISSLKITDRSFRYASPRLWNQLPDSFRRPHQPCLDSLPHSLVNTSPSSSPLSSSITPSLQAQTYLFQQTLPTLILLPWTAFTITGPDRTYRTSRFIFSLFFFFNFSVRPVRWTKFATCQLFTAL